MKFRKEYSFKSLATGEIHSVGVDVEHAGDGFWGRVELARKIGAADQAILAQAAADGMALIHERLIPLPVEPKISNN